jgi:hypothetical protein
VHCLRSLGSRDRRFESHSGHGCLVFVYVCAFFCLCTGKGLATGLSPVQGVLPTVPDQETEETQPHAPNCGSNEKGNRKYNLLMSKVGKTTTVRHQGSIHGPF